MTTPEKLARKKTAKLLLAIFTNRAKKTYQDNVRLLTTAILEAEKRGAEKELERLSTTRGKCFLILILIAKAVLEEREESAKIAENLPNFKGAFIASRIRARSTAPTKSRRKGER